MPNRGARLIRCHAKEAGFFVTRALQYEESFEEAGQRLSRALGCSAGGITRGEKGMSFSKKRHHVHHDFPHKF